jgi:hypothetical protein
VSEETIYFLYAPPDSIPSARLAYRKSLDLLAKREAARLPLNRRLRLLRERRDRELAFQAAHREGLARLEARMKPIYDAFTSRVEAADAAREERNRKRRERRGRA